MTNRELNEAVARKLGWKQDYYPESGRSPNIKFWFKPGHKSPDNLPRYSEAIEAAWGIVEKLVSSGYGVCIDKDDNEEEQLIHPPCRGWHCNISSPQGRDFSDSIGESAPMVICKAFLKLKEEFTR